MIELAEFMSRVPPLWLTRETNAFFILCNIYTFDKRYPLAIMARNTEKAQFMLNRYLAGREEELGLGGKTKKKRPHIAQECNDLHEADGWRHQVLREIGAKVMEIQNEGLGEQRLRDLNDEINKLMRIKSHWERRIVELGGPDYSKLGPKVTDSKGTSLGRDSRGVGYRYYGAAKNLPGVKELFERDAGVVQKKATRGELQRRIDVDYYGFRDEDDGRLTVVEAEAEVVMRERAMEEWHRHEAHRGQEKDVQDDSVPGAEFVAYVPLPEHAVIEAKILETKKQRLLSKYASESLTQEQERMLPKIT